MANLGKPLGDRVLLKLEDTSDKKSAGGIILNQSTQPTQRATVVAVSDGYIISTGEIVPLTVKVDDTVLIMNANGTKIRIEKEDYILTRESEILMVV